MDNRRSVERVADVIRGCRAEVVCLQEVHKWLPQSRMQDQPRMLSRLLGMRCYYLPSYHVGPGSFGNAILTNLPVHRHRRHPLPNHGERRSLIFLLERRAMVSAEVETEAGPLRVLTTHLSLNRFDRMKSVERIREVTAESEAPVVLCGDLNARPESEEMRFLAEKCGLVDAGCDGNAPTYSAGRPTARIDYVWHSKSLSYAALKTLDSQASDHLPVVAEFS
jgi:endonuclease/exonuclease/phosphatase family metal-dependent hydrolase